MPAKADREFVVASWNVNGWHTIHDAQLDPLDRTGAEVALLQEVTSASMARLSEAGWHGASALQLLPKDHVERDGVRPRLAAAIVARDPAAIDVVSVIAEAPSAVRTAVGDLRLGGHTVHMVSAALPPGSRWGRAPKVAQAHALEQHLPGSDHPTVLGMDRNGPKHEAWTANDTEWWPEDAPSFFAEDASHGLRDVLLSWLDTHPEEATRARAERPEGPAAVSYMEKRANPPVARRYDVVLAGPQFEVVNLAYRYIEATTAGSDHALVTARLMLTAFD